MTPSRNHSAAPLLAVWLLLGAVTAAAQTGGVAPEAGTPAAPAAGATASAPATPLPPDMSVLPMLGPGKIKITVSLDRAVIRVGELIHYTMTVSAPADAKVMMPPPGAQLGEFLIRDYSFPGLEEPESVSALDRVRNFLGSISGGSRSPGQTFSFVITAYTVGDLEIPAMPVAVVDPSGRTYALHAESARVRVAAVTNPDDLTIRDIKPPRALPVNYRPALPWLLLPVGLIALAAVAWWRLRRRKLAESAPVALRPEDEVALEELAALAADGLLEAGDFERFYTRLSFILRRYLALRFSIYALEYTTTEIVARLGQAWLDHADFDRIRNLLEEADRVKFARQTPALEERSTALDRVREIVEHTRRRPAPEPERMAA